MEQNGATSVTIQVIPPPESNCKQEVVLATEYQEEEEITGENAGSAVKQFDSTQEFDEVFGDKRSFDSWDEFTGYLELFQKRSGTRFKPRQASRVEFTNEKRVGTPIPARFVYSGIRLICVHYGEAGASKKRRYILSHLGMVFSNFSGQSKSYVGRGCEAYLRLGYGKGTMRIRHFHLIHTNHEPTYQEDDPVTRNFRVCCFTEELDHILIEEVLKANPFQFKCGEKEWIEAVECLKTKDEKFANITPREVKKRTRLLLDNFAAITQGKKPAEEDEMGMMLFALDQAKKIINDEIPGMEKTPKRRMRGRPRKVSASEDDDGDGPVSYSQHIPKAKRSRLERKVPSSFSPPPSPSQPQTFSPPASPTKSGSNVTHSSKDISTLLSYLQKKDKEERVQRKDVEEDRRIRQKEWEEDRKQRQLEAEEDRKLRLREMELRQEELAFQKERFEFEKSERKLHMDLLKSQLQVFEQSMLMKQSQSQPPPQPPLA